MAESSIAGAAEVSPNVVHDEESKTLTVRHVGTLHMYFGKVGTVHVHHHHHVSERIQDQEEDCDGSTSYQEVSPTLTVRHVDTLHVGNVDTVHVGDSHHHHVLESVQDQEDCDGSTSYQGMEVDAYIEPINGAVTTAEGGAGAFEADREILQCLQNLFANFNKPEEWEKNLNTCTELAARYKHQGRTVQAKVQVDSVRSFDRVMNRIGEALGVNENLMTLGLHLGFQHSKVEMFLATNRANGNVSPKGTKNMIFAWSKKTPIAKQVEELRDALVKADFRLVADEHL